MRRRIALAALYAALLPTVFACLVLSPFAWLCVRADRLGVAIIDAIVGLEVSR